MTGQEIIDLSDILTDGLSELTSANKLAQANRKYYKLKNERDWEDLVTSSSIAIASNAIALPSDFKKFTVNVYGQDAEYKNVFYILTTPHAIIRFAERKRFTDLSYYDPSNTQIVTPDSIEGDTAILDYIKTVTALTVSSSPVITNTDYHSIIAYAMAVEHYSIDQSEAGRSKERQYQATYNDMLQDMEYDDNQLKEAGTNYA